MVDVVRTNLIENPSPTSDSSWRISTGDVLEFVSDDGGAPCLEARDDVGVGSLFVDPESLDAPPVGKWVAFSVDLKALNAEAVAEARLRLVGYSGVVIAAATYPVITTTDFTRVAVAGEVTASDPAGFVRSLVWPNQLTTPGSGYRLRRAVRVIADTEAEAVEQALGLGYFDGDTPNTPDFSYAWTGTPHASTSVEYLTAGIRTEVFTDAPCPRVGITLTGLDESGPSVVTVYRSSPGGKRRPVRGLREKIVYGSDYVIDYEAPLGRDVTYELEVVSGAEVPLRLADTTFVDVAAGYIQDPLVPGSAVPILGKRRRDNSGVVLRGQAVTALEYGIGSSLVPILGSSEPVDLTGQRMVASGVDFSMLTRANEESTALRELLAKTAKILIRGLPHWQGLPDLAYTVPRVTEMPGVDTSVGRITTWAITGNLSTPPSLSVLVPLWTYDDVEAIRQGMTYSDVQAAAVAATATYLDDQRDPTLGGA